MTSPSTVLLRTQSDERLVALARAGHERAFEAIVERYRKPLLRACRRILPEARAEDALQHTLVAAWRGLERGDEVRELRPWLYRIARNTSLNQLRMSGYDLDELMETLTAADDPEEEVLRRAVVRQTLSAVAALPERQREALLRTAINGQGQEEVARDLGLSSTAMRQLVHRARVSVRAAATAVVPMPVATWLAAGAGGAGTAATLAKAGTLVVLAGGAVSAPALIEHGPPTPRHRSEAHAAAKPRPRDEAAPVPAATAAAQLTVATTTRRVVATVSAPRAASRRSDHSGRRESERGDDAPTEQSSSSGPGGGGEAPSGRDGGGEDRSGPGGGDDSGGDDSQGHQEPVATPVPTPEANDEPEVEEDGGHGGSDNSGPGSADSSGSTGSGSGKGSSGSDD
jgi:RNA polymerase sigma factor (sigma-70 family)